MKTLILLSALLFGQFVLASDPPANFPIVKGVVRKVEIPSGRISIKHEEIPNLHMPGMTMSFLAQDPQILSGLVVGDKINFVADEIDDELTVLWIEKAAPPSAENSNILCTGVANTSPKTNVEIEFRRERFSTIRYEYAEGPYQGTSYINSIGSMELHNRNGFFISRAGTGVHDSKLIFKVQDGKITDSCFTNFSAGMENSPVQCSFE
jgi:Cu/Ag efflux protein CusF